MNYIEKAFLVNLSDYQNLGVNLPVNIVLLCLFAGFAIGFIAFDFCKKYMNLTVRQLLRHNAVGEENAVTLSAVGLGNSRIVRHFLSGSGHLSKIVLRRGAVSYTYEEYVAMQKKRAVKREKIDFATAEFYISPEYLDRAKRISNGYRTSALKVVLSCAFLAVLYFCLMLAMPEILTLLDNIVGALQG